jgi:peptidoglycan hydrolase CwlO-like protein
MIKINMMRAKKFFSFSIIVLTFFFIPFSFAQDASVDLNKANLERKISEYQQKLAELRQQKNTLTSQIQYMNTQIALTELKIEQTKEKIKTTEDEIEKLGERIGGLDQSIDYLTKLLVGRFVATYKNRGFGLLQILFASDNASSLASRYQYLKSTQEENQRLLVRAQATKINLEEQKQLREEKITELDQLKNQLDRQIGDLNNQKVAKERLLSETQNSEVVYQRLIEQARAQLQAFRGFVSVQGGASILSNQTVCDDWGCYYNQRDAQWGNLSLNNTQYTIASDGCLVTSMAMIYTHYGYREVNPITINSNPFNFASYYPAWLSYNITAGGKSSSRVFISLSEMDQELSNNRPVVVGTAYNSCYKGGRVIADHFVVLTKKEGNDYIMKDPFTPNGNNISFYSKYSLICEIYKVNF